MKYTKEWCQYEFSEKEKQELAVQMATKSKEQEVIELQKKSAMASFKDRVEQCNLELKHAATCYHDGYEMRDIECLVEKDFDGGVVRYIRTDTGEVARVKKMSAEERQTHVDDVGIAEDMA